MTRAPLLLAFALATAASLVVFAPLGLAARAGAWPGGLSVQQAEGTLWNGRFTGVRWQGQALDAVDAALHPLSWVWGAPRLGLRTGELDLAWSGGRVRGLHRGHGSIALAPLPSWGGLSLALDLDDLQLAFADGQCLRARGSLQVRADGAALPDGAFRLAGQPRCEDGQVRIDLAPLQPSPGQPDVRADVRIGAGGHYRVAVRVASQDPAVATALALAGFQSGPGGASRVVEGPLGEDVLDP